MTNLSSLSSRRSRSSIVVACSLMSPYGDATSTSKQALPGKFGERFTVQDVVFLFVLFGR